MSRIRGYSISNYYLRASLRESRAWPAISHDPHPPQKDLPAGGSQLKISARAILSPLIIHEKTFVRRLSRRYLVIRSGFSGSYLYLSASAVDLPNTIEDSQTLSAICNSFNSLRSTSIEMLTETDVRSITAKDRSTYAIYQRQQQQPGAPTHRYITAHANMMRQLITLLLATATAPTISAQPQPDVKYFFFCGTDFADIQTDTCEQRQWCPSASDDECTVPGHTCFANTPCDARLIEGIAVPTYSLSLYPEYKDATDKMFCGENYQEALSVCEVGDEQAKGRHCPNGISDCPSGQFCFIDMPCSYFVMISELINNLENPNDIEVIEADLPDPGSLESHYFCGATFSQAADNCSSKTWCRTGTNQECPNGEICFVSVDNENPKCEINAIVKAEYEAAQMAQAEEDARPKDPTKIPTLSPISSSDDKNKLFCGFDWNDASSNCDLSRFCPGGTDEECPPGMSCQEYTTCDASVLTFMPSGSPTPKPTSEPTARERVPTQSPTTAKPSREPTPPPSGTPTKRPTNAPSKKPTYSPLPYGDFRREFWCGLDWFDAGNNCAQKCPSGDDADCPGDLLCMSGVASCKNEMGFGAYGPENGINITTTVPPVAGGEDDQGEDAGLQGTSSTVAAATTTALIFVNTGDATRPAEGMAGDDAAKTTTAATENGQTTTIAGSTEVPATLPPLEGPYTDEMVRIVLYGIEAIDTAALNRWSTLTANYFERFFNDYDEEDDVIRSNITDMFIELSNVNQEVPPDHDFNPLNDPSKKRNLRQVRRVQVETDTRNAQTMITFDQTSTFRSYLDVLNEDPQLITRRPLETPVYRAEYVTYLRSVDFDTYGNLTFVSHMLYTDFPTPAPSLSPTPEPSLSPVEPGQPTLPPNTDAPTTAAPETDAPTFEASWDMSCNLCKPGQYGVNADIIWDGKVSSCVDIYNYFLVNHKEGGSVCRQGQEQLSTSCCSGDGEPLAQPANPPSQSEENVQITVDENGLPDAAGLSETYYCGKNWNSIDCATATACPDGDSNSCPDGEGCIAFTNCGGSFTFVNDPNVEGGGPDVDAVKSTFFCGSSKQFLEMKCDGATPCPNGPKDCTGQDEGCFAFTGCNKSVDPGSFVGFLAKPPEDTGPVTETKKTFYCGATWADLDSRCNENGIPVGATACPSGDILDCPDGFGCFAFACNNVVLDESIAIPAPAPSNNIESEFSVEDVNTLKSTFFCGTSIEAIDSDCSSAKPCPNGDECDANAGEGCFAFSTCGGVDIDALVDTFGQTDRPTRAPSVPVEQVCDEQAKMSVNMGYWQSWSIYRADDCQRMDTASFDASPYTHVIYSFASIDSKYRLEAWNGTYDNEIPLYQAFNTVKQRHPGIKTMIAVGGWTHNDPGPMQTRFSEMAASQTNRKVFAQSVVQFLRTYGFDGLDLDWEYPALPERGGKREDYDNYVLMAKELRSAFNAAPEDYTLTVALTGNVTKLEMGFDLEGLAEHIDWFNLMAYDLWGSWDPKQIAYSHTDIRMIDEAIDYMSHFIQRSQIVMGLGSYARTYTLSDDECLDLGCPFEGPGQAGCEGTDGFLPYFEIADLITTRQFDMVRFDEESESMVMVTDGNRLISYDNTVSFNKKSEYSEENCLRGVMLWAIDMLKDNSNPLSSNNGNTLLTGDPSDQNFCGRDYQDVISSCRQPCRSGSSDECPAGEICFVNTGCSIDNIGAAPPTKCRLCPDPSTQGMKTWLEVEFGGNTTTCGEADLSVINTFATGTEQCDAAKDALQDQCCYNYPENPCMLCRTETEFMDLNALAEVEFNGESMTCFDLMTLLGPESADSGICLDAQAELFDQCCFNQCKLCEGKGVRWWVEVELDGDNINCGELDSVLYKNSTEEDDDMCRDVLSNHGEECCYEYPDNPCDICTSGDRRLTLMPTEELEFDGSTYTCAEVNNFVSVFDGDSMQCDVAVSAGSDLCCFDRCSLCGTGARLDFDVFIEIDGEQKTCADIEAGLLQERVTADNDNCTETRSLYYDSCCFEIPNDSCQLCQNDEYMLFSEMVEFNGDEVSCRSVDNHLIERADETSKLCYDTRAEHADTCCYKACNICGDTSVDWDVFINYEGKDVSCGDLKEIFRETQVIDGSEQCSAIAEELRDTCCYTSPTTSCQLCKHAGVFYEVNDNVEVDFNGPTTCADVANFLTRRIDENDAMCSTTQSSYYKECCFDKCMLVTAEGSYPDWTASVEMDGKSATCLDIDNAINDAGIVKGSAECTSLQDAFSTTCSFTIPTNPCDICPSNDVSPLVTVQYDGKEMKCSDIQSRLKGREEMDGEKCTAAKDSLQECCFDQCHLCSEGQEIDSSHTIYYNGKTIPCSDTETIFNEKGVLASSEQCSADQAAFSEECCYVAPKSPCNICKRGVDYFDVMATNSATYDNKKQTCSAISDNISKREEDQSEKCNNARDSLFDSCCDTKCSLCGEKGLDAGVQVSYEGRTMTCLELDLGLSVEEGSDQCSAITSQFTDQCCYEKPETPCRICGVGQSVDTDAQAFYLGTNTTCDNLSNYLGSREEQGGQTCQSAITDFADACCYDQCTLCGEGKADWNTFVTYKEQSIACGDFEWILRGDNVVAGSDTCQAVQDEYYEKCCYEPLSTSCNLCQDGINYFDVQPDVVVQYQQESTTCLSVYNSLFVREAADSEQCNAAKGTLAGECCFQKCKLCEGGFIDTDASVMVNGAEMSCSALDLSFSQSVVAEGSDQCSTMRQSYAEECCYTMPATPCRLCSGVYDASSNVMVDFYGEQKTCSEISNKLALSEEAGSETCSAVQSDFLESCCYEKCPVCPTGSNLSWEKNVEYNKSTISCGEFDSIIRNGAIAKGSQECNTILSVYSSPCCYNYATSTGGGSATQENTPPPPPPDVNFSEVDSTVEGTITLQKEIGDKVQAGETIASVGAITPPPPPDASFTEIQSTKEGTVTIQKQVGDMVQAGETIMSVAGEGGESELKATENGYVAVILPKEGAGVKDGETVALIATNKEEIATVQEYANDLATADAGAQIIAEEDGFVAALLTPEGGRVQDGQTIAFVAEKEEDIATVQEYASGLAASQAASGNSASYAAPCSLCSTGEIAVDTDILFNGVQTSCLEVYNFLATQTKAGSETCTSGKEALQDACCLKKCDICSGGGIPDWYANVNVNGNSMTCLELDGIISNSQIEQGSPQCKEVLDVAAPACCYTPPTEPCNICQTATDVFDVMSEKNVEYGGATATCGQIFNALYTREERESQTCSMVSADLASECCYNKCSLCGDLQLDASTSVDHSGTKVGCSEFDSFIFASDLITEGTDECSMFQAEYRDTCCYDVPCNLCSKKDKVFSIKEEASVTYGGTQTTCSDVSDFLSQDMSQSNNCLAAQENIFNDCCFEPCEMCSGAGESINWASTTTFNGVYQSCTDVYWMLINDGIEATNPVCNGVSQLSADCCFKMPTYQCTLCRDDNGVTYNTRWMQEVKVGGVTKTCGDFNTLLSTQEADSLTCTSAREEIFDACCFAGSEELVAESPAAVVATDNAEEEAFDPNACQLCPVDKVGIDADVNFNGNPTTCVDVYNFLYKQFNKVSESCTSAQSQLAELCCRDPSELKPGENAAFGQMNADGSVPASSPGNAITPPTDFEGFNSWTIMNPNSARGSAKLSCLCTAVGGAVTLVAFLF